MANVAETATEHSRLLAVARLSEARATHAREVADLEAQAERATEEEWAQQARERVTGLTTGLTAGLVETLALGVTALPWAGEVIFPRALYSAFCNDGRTSSSRGSGHVLIDAGKGSCRRVRRR